MGSLFSWFRCTATKPKAKSGGLWVSVACALVHVTFMASVASATVLLPADFTTIVTGSPIIVHGRVADVRSFLSGPRRTIESVVTLTVIDTLKGVPARTVLFRVPNGQVGRYRVCTRRGHTEADRLDDGIREPEGILGGTVGAALPLDDGRRRPLRTPDKVRPRPL